jgi:hypothetical protein
MTRHIPDGSITTDADFRAALAEATEQAITAGVDVRGAWEFQTGGSVHNWEVEIYELARESDDGES